jgi:hypothetical protein
MYLYSSVSAFVAACVPRIFGCPSESNLSVVQFLPNRVFNSNYFFTILHMFWRDEWEAKSENLRLSVCFVLVQIQTDFPSKDQEISLKSPIFPSDKTFSK